MNEKVKSYIVTGRILQIEIIIFSDDTYYFRGEKAKGGEAFIEESKEHPGFKVEFVGEIEMTRKEIREHIEASTMFAI